MTAIYSSMRKVGNSNEFTYIKAYQQLTNSNGN